VGVNVYEKLRTVLDINKALGSTLDIDQVLPKILDGLFTVFPQSDRAYVLFPDEETGQLQVKAQKQKEEGTLATSALGPISHTVANRVMSQAEAILSADGIDDNEYDISESVLDFPIRSMMCAPLLGPMQKPLGIIYVDTNDPYEHFHEDDLEVLISVAATAGQALEYAHAHEAQLRLDRRNRELATAKEVQLHFLPQSLPHVPGYRFFHYYKSAEEVGGDYYGYVPLPDGRLAVTLGDVSGKGISAALVMARLCSEVRYRLVTEGDPCRAIEALNREFSRPENDPWFVTFVLCVLDPRVNEMTIVNAGHKPIIRRNAETRRVEELGQNAIGLPLGCDQSMEYDVFKTSLQPGDSLLIYTDGINEAMNSKQELYGMDRLREAIRTGPERIDDLCDSLLSDMRRFTEDRPQSDDICLIGLQRS
jgi:serine phosphatase RsbU (regulator of sigma subunit)